MLCPDTASAAGLPGVRVVVSFAGNQATASFVRIANTGLDGIADRYGQVTAYESAP